MIWQQEIACKQISDYSTPSSRLHTELLCRLDSSGNVRVGDLGLAEDVYTQGYFRQGKDDAVKLPFKWMAPESLRDGLFGEKSDVVRHSINALYLLEIRFINFVFKL